jgi:hypothetical protein
VQTTVSAIQSSPTLTQTFLTTTNQPSLANSRYLATGTGLNLTDGGAQSTMTVALTGAPASLVTVGNGLLAKTNSTTLAARTIGVSGGLSVTDGDGVGGNPAISTTGLLNALAATSGTGLLATAGGATITPVTIAGTANEIDVAAGNTSPVIGLADNPVLPGVASATLPAGATGDRPASAVDGMIRYNTDTLLFEGYLNGAWTSFASGSGVTSIATGTGLTGGPITSTGTISIDGTVVTLTGTQTLTNKTLTSPVLTTPALGTPASGVLTNATGLPLTTGVTGNLPVTNLNSGTSASASTFWRGDGSWATPAGGGGTVTSVSFTGGIISVATATTTPALTIAGTSGGIPYFSSSSTWASSAALTQYGIVYGGGAGATPVATAAGTTGQVLTATTGGAPIWATPASAGTVTSVAQSFTGGLISVAGSPITSSGTLALTVAGTSGGVPYFDSGTTWATSAALAANAIVLGGGAGFAPATTATGTGVVTALGVNTGTAGAFVVNGGALGTPSSGTLTSATGLPISTGVSGLGTGVATALAVNTGSAGALVTFDGALGTPSSGTVTILTGTASININGTVGATTATTGAFTTVTATTGIFGGTF